MLIEKKEYCSGIARRFVYPFALCINSICPVSNLKQAKRNKLEVPRNSTYLLLIVEVGSIAIRTPQGKQKPQ